MRFPLTLRILCYVGGLLSVVALLAAWLTFRHVQQVALDQLSEKGAALADSLNYTFEVLLSQNDQASLQRVVENVATVPGVTRVLIVGRDQRVMTANDRAQLGQPVADPLTRDFLQRQDWQRVSEYTEAGELVIVQPLRGGRFVGGVGGDIVGAVQIALDRQAAELAARSVAMNLLLIIAGAYLLSGILLFAILRRIIVQPLHKIIGVAHAFRDGDLKVRSGIRRSDELGQLSQTFDHMATTIAGNVDNLEQEIAARTADLTQKNTEMVQKNDELARSIAERERLSETILQLSTPVIRLHGGVVMMPLIGTIDSARAQQVVESLLAGVERYQARTVIIDLSGVPLIDTQVAGHLLQAIRAARLLGCEALLCGISPEVAETIIHLGIDMSTVPTLPDLQNGIAHALRNLNGRSQLTARRGHSNGRAPNDQLFEAAH